MTEMTKRMALFSGSVNPELSEEIAKYLNVNLGNIKHEKFANGEIYARYQESIRGADVFLIQSVCASEGYDVNDALMELLIMADAAKRASARSISAVIAHYGYARQDRKAAPREPITAKLVADLLTVSGVDNVITVDLHQDAIQGFFDIPVNHMTAMPIFVDYFKNKGFDTERLCVVSPDVGRAKAAKKFSTALDCDIAIMHKDRPKHNQAEITALIGDVTDKICILNDDMIDTAGSLVAAAQTLKAKGAAEVYACATHGLFSGPAYERLENSPIEEVVVTNAVPVPLARQTGKIKVLSIAPLFAQTIDVVYNNGSIGKLFEQMHIIAGLGNPGEEYEHTRHNAGFDTVDALANELGVRYWKTEGGALTAKASYHGHELLLVKPQSFMNTSGGPVSKLARAYKVAPDHLIVIHDELDIDPGTIRVKFGGGHAGHNGLRSICDKLGTRDWFRVRIGIGRPPGRKPVVDWVLSQPRSKDDTEVFEHAVDQGAQAVLFLIDNGLEKTQAKFN